jgi:hypothetical protein
MTLKTRDRNLILGLTRGRVPPNTTNPPAMPAIKSEYGETLELPPNEKCPPGNRYAVSNINIHDMKNATVVKTTIQGSFHNLSVIPLMARENASITPNRHPSK